MISARDQRTLGVLAGVGIVVLAAIFAGTVQVPTRSPVESEPFSSDPSGRFSDRCGQPSERWAFAIDPNRAEIVELVILPGLGPKLAQKIIEYRRTNPPFTSPADLEKVNGIGPKKRAKIEPFLIWEK